ncbi:hypothetical protein BUALT_Bualt14G0052800 [Buddleja alternifolia]|uniref:NB-ARC domain-containing protein n=1 Tax=Buddleja alternifolia TaxID=168488 RepID=A0AAV6WHZ8_9LAMI|nr:hypothetical protein BUALT_Bualt14G0052800 [Buddleja alternifolia]
MQLDPKTEQIAKQIVSECGGLPLAVTVISHVLRGFKLEDWGVTLQSLQKDQNFETAEEVMALSYNHLPFYLKPCFLYLGHFPPDHEILVEKLYLLWMAEGFISMNPLNNKARTEVAEDYINQLVQRNLVLMVKPNHSCTLHDLLRDVSISKGKQDEFLEIIDFGHGNEISPKARRVSIYLDKFVDQSQFSINISEAKHIRSILFVETDKSLPKRTWPKTFSDLKEFQQTRVLDFDGVDFTDKRLPRGIEKLYYLRYLSFQQCNLQKLPSSLSNFPFLETLDLRVRVSCIITIPNILTKLSSLRHLYFPKAFRSDTKDKLKLDGLQKLEILENFNAGISDADDLLLLEKLEILTVTVAGENMDLDKTIRSLNGNKSSCKSSLVVKDFDSYSKQRIKIVEEMFKCNALHSLDIEGYLGKLPHSEPIGSNFSKMVFNGSEFSEDPMPILGKLPNLDSLVLCNDAFVGKKMECSDSDFPRLTSLKLATLQNLEEWEVDSAAMPCLTILTIEQCDKLINLPNELIEIFTLEKFMIGLMPKGFQEEVEELIEEARSFGNDYINATFYDC